MNLLIAMHGIKQDVDRAIKWLETRLLPIKVKYPDGKEGTAQLQLRVSEIKLLHLSYGKENHDTILKTLKPKESFSLTDKEGKKVLTKTFNLIRRALKLQKIPKADPAAQTLLLPDGLLTNVRVIGIGQKEDIEATFPNGLTHEAI